MTFNGIVEMARVRRDVKLVYIRGIFQNGTLGSNGSNVFEVTTFNGTVEMARVKRVVTRYIPYKMKHWQEFIMVFC